MDKKKKTKKEINIITCHWPINYGAVLQAYALQNYIIELGYNVKIIDYIPVYAKKIEKDRILRVLFRWYDLIKGKISFDSFKKKYLKLTDRMNGCINSNLDDEKKIFIAGSDQIWNPILDNGKDNNYFLGFVNKGIKTSYAASIGIDKIPNQQIPFYKKMLKDFKRISVREYSGKEQLIKAGLNNVECVVDPVFLLSKEKWQQFGEKSNVKEKNYILVYAFRRDVAIYNYAKKLACERKCKVVAISNSLIDIKNMVDKFYWNPDPKLFISLLMNAKEVVTNSFHGFSFSIIFQKPMHIFQLNSLGNERLVSLATRFDLKDRLIIDGKWLLDDKIVIGGCGEIESSKKYLEELLNDYGEE